MNDIDHMINVDHITWPAIRFVQPSGLKTPFVVFLAHRPSTYCAYDTGSADLAKTIVLQWIPIVFKNP